MAAYSGAGLKDKSWELFGVRLKVAPRIRVEKNTKYPFPNSGRLEHYILHASRPQFIKECMEPMLSANNYFTNFRICTPEAFWQQMIYIPLHNPETSISI